MSAVIDKPRTARRSVVLGNRVAGASAGFHWYCAGREAERRFAWMMKARHSAPAQRAYYVKQAREYHHRYLREVSRALEMQSWEARHD